MQAMLTNKFLFLLVATTLSFGVAFTAAAESSSTYTTYDELEVEIEFEDDVAIVEVSYEEDGEDVEKTFRYNETDESKLKQLIADDLDTSYEVVKEAMKFHDRNDDLDVEDVEDAIADAEEEIEKAEAYVEANGDSHGWMKYAYEYLENAKDELADGNLATAHGWATRAEDKATLIQGQDPVKEVKDKDTKWEDKVTDSKEKQEFIEWKRDKSEYGKGDVAELQQQLRELLTLLIQLLQQQQVLLNAAS